MIDINYSVDFQQTRDKEKERESVASNPSMFYDEQEETFVIRWEGKVDKSDIHAGYAQVLEHVKNLKPKKWLLDLKNRHTIRREDQLWVFQHVFPEVLRLIGDDVFVAVVLPLTLYHGLVEDLNGDEMMDNNNFLIMQQFLYEEEAQRWLSHMQLLKKGERSIQLLHTRI